MKEAALETEQARPTLSKWINDKRSEKQANSDTNRDLYHRKAHVECNRIESSDATNVWCANSSRIAGAVADDLISWGEALYQRALHTEARRNLYKDSRQHGGCSQAVTDLAGMRDETGIVN